MYCCPWLLLKVHIVLFLKMFLTRQIIQGTCLLTEGVRVSSTCVCSLCGAKVVTRCSGYRILWVLLSLFCSNHCGRMRAVRRWAWPWAAHRNGNGHDLGLTLAPRGRCWCSPSRWSLHCIKLHFQCHKMQVNQSPKFHKQWEKWHVFERWA